MFIHLLIGLTATFMSKHFCSQALVKHPLMVLPLFYALTTGTDPMIVHPQSSINGFFKNRENVLPQ